MTLLSWMTVTFNVFKLLYMCPHSCYVIYVFDVHRVNVIVFMCLTTNRQGYELSVPLEPVFVLSH